VGYGALIAHRCPQRWFPASFLLADDPGVERYVNTREFHVPNPRKSAARKPVGRFGRFTSKWRCQCGCRMRADFPGVISPKPVWGQCDKRTLLGALCLVRMAYDMCYR